MIGPVPGIANVLVAVCPKGATVAPAVGRAVARAAMLGESRASFVRSHRLVSESEPCKFRWTSSGYSLLIEGDRMFVSHQVDIDKPFEAVEQGLSGNLHAWLSSIVERSDQPDEVRLTVGGERGLLSKWARLRAGPLHSRMDGATIPLRLEATGPTALFPRLDADLVIAPLEGDRTRLTLRGSYAPTLGRVGEMADRVLLHRVAESTLQRLVAQIAKSLQDHSMV